MLRAPELDAGLLGGILTRGEQRARIPSFTLLATGVDKFSSGLCC